MAGKGFIFNPTTGRGSKSPVTRNEQPVNGIPQTPPITTPPKVLTPTTHNELPKPRLDALGDFMVRTVERERDKIESELKELRKKYEALQEEKTSIEKQLDEASRELKEKPTGLSGIVQSNPDLAKTAMEMGLPLLAGLGEKLIAWISTQQQQPKQLNGATEAEPGTNPIWLWLIAQPKEIQENFVMLLEKLDATGRAKDYLESWNRQLMRVVPKNNVRNV
jgi:hypothetical protein